MMYEHILQRMRECVRRGDVRISYHASIEMLKDSIGRYDVELTTLGGKMIERQYDRKFAEYKYRVLGKSYNGRSMEVVAKLEHPDTVIITAYLWLAKDKKMKCGHCGQDSAYISRSTSAFGEGDRLVVVENVPVISCRECGTEFLSITTFGQIERISNNRASIPMQPVPVTRFQDEEDPVLAPLAEAVA